MSKDFDEHEHARNLSRSASAQSRLSRFPAVRPRPEGSAIPSVLSRLVQ